MRYHVVVFLVPDPSAIDQEVILDEEFDWPESRHKVIDVISAGIEELKTEAS